MKKLKLWNSAYLEVKPLKTKNKKLTITLYPRSSKRKDWIHIDENGLWMSHIFLSNQDDMYTIHPVPTLKTIWLIIKYFFTHKFDGSGIYYLAKKENETKI